jgi:hypothetical protein
MFVLVVSYQYRNRTFRCFRWTKTKQKKRNKPKKGENIIKIIPPAPGENFYAAQAPTLLVLFANVGDPDPGSGDFYPLDPGWIDPTSRIPDPAHFWGRFPHFVFRILGLFIFMKLDPETESEMNKVGSRSGIKSFLDPDPGSNIPDPQHCSKQDNLLKGNKS